MTIRQKNLHFVARIAESLQLSTLSGTSSTFQDTLASIKRALSPQAVRAIHLAIPEIWPNKQDPNRCLLELRGSHSGVFSGDYSYKTTLRLVNRHALYDSRIILIDPFLDYRILIDEFNPVLHPEKHLSNTLHYVLWWLSLVPWIEEGIILVIPDPGNLDQNLMMQSLQSAEERGKALAVDLEAELEDIWAIQRRNDFAEQMMLYLPDEEIIRHMPSSSQKTEANIKQVLASMRESSPYHVQN
jgi:hypothetical protein